MEKLELTSEEKRELKKRGFFTKRILYFKEFLLTIPALLILGPIVSSFIMFIVSVIFLILGIDLLVTDNLHYYLIPYYYITFNILLDFISHGTIFFFLRDLRIYQLINQRGKLHELVYNLFLDFTRLSKQEQIVYIFATTVPFIILIPLIISEYPTFSYVLSFISIYTFIFYILAIILRQLMEKFHPLYAFGNIGERLQIGTREIESQSKLIQLEFQKDMNFSVLHSGFEKLSSTFGEIVSLVPKLEQIEARANKGNLFDSEKYIGSLRSDIVIPLEELKRFLEKQKEELLKLQKELTRVRVGGSESTGNVELQSKRSESLITELDTNIGALSEMIEKMG